MYFIGNSKRYIMKRRKLSKEKYFRRNSISESGVELYSLFKEMNEIRNGIKGVVNSGYTHQVKFPTFRKELKKSLEQEW